MSGWIVYSKDGSHERCKLRSLEYGGTAMGERAVTATFDFHSEVAFEVFDYIEYRGERFELEAVPTVKKLSSFEYQYELRFVSLKYELERCEMRDLVPSDNGVVYPTPLTFSFTGDVRYLTDRIQACLDAMYGAGVWKITIAEGTSSEEKNITIAQQNCWNALALVNSTYGLNFYIKGRTITIGGEQPLVSHTFEYGKGNGLYEIERASDTETGIVTKLRAYGSTRNLDYSYPKKPEWSDSVLPVSFALSPLRLMLPSFKTDGKTDYVLADNAAIAKYGIREASMVYDDIYPSIAGATYNGQAIDEIKAVDAVDESQKTFVVYLHELGFDLEEHLTTSDAQISMKSGALQGYTFTISSIEKQTGGYKITLGKNSLENSEESGAYVPGVNWNMKAGDKFVLLNILMPQKYIRDAENRLLARANEYLAQYSKTNFSYNIGLHNKFLIQNPSVYDSLIEGSKLKVYDKEIGIDEEVTIQSITITENLEDNILPQVKVTLNNEPSASTLDRIQGKLNEVAAETAANGFTTQSEIMAQYRRKLDKPFFDKLFVAIDANGNEIPSTDVITPIAYIKAKYHVASVGGFTMYAMGKDVDVPSLASGLPFDRRTIWYNPDTQQIEVIGGTGGGSGEGVSNFWDLSGIPSWITNTKPKYTYSEIEGTPDLSGYATESWVLGKSYITSATLGTELAKYVTLDTDQPLKGKKDFKNGLSIDGLEIRKSEDDVVYIDANLVVRGGVTMYAQNEVDIPSIIDSIPTASTTVKGIASFDGAYFSVVNGKVSLIASNVGLNEEELYNYLTSNNYAKKTDIPSLVGYATQSWVNTRIDSLINGAPAAYDTLKEIADVLQGNVNSIGDIITALGTKWTQDNTKIANWDTAYSWGNHANVGYALKSYVDSTFVTLGSTQTITGEKNFTGGLKVNGSPIYYDTEKKYWKLEGDLLVTGGVTMYGNEGTFTPSTIMDAIAVDGTTISKSGGVLKVIGGTSGGVADSVAWANITGKPTWIGSSKPTYSYSEITGAISTTELQNYLTQNSYLNVTSGDNRYLLLSGGTLTGALGINTSVENSGLSISYNGTPMGSLCTNGSTFEMFNTEGYGITTLGKNLYALYNWNRYTLWHSGNDGSGSGLDADLLDGKNLSDIIRYEGLNNNGNAAASAQTITYWGEGNWGHGSTYGTSLNIQGAGLWNHRIDFRTDGILDYYQGINTGDMTHIGAIAFTSSNVASATKLQTARTIWGQSFDGTGNVSGDISNTSSIAFDTSAGAPNIGYLWTNTRGMHMDMSGLGTEQQGTNLTLTPSGNVGIGTASPTYKLDVNGPSRSQYMLFLNTSFNGNAGYIGRGGTASNDIYLLSSGSLHLGTNNVDSKVLISTNGNVGIGFVQPSHKLEVNGDGYFSSNLTVGGGITMYSDQRKKTILNHVELSLKQIANAPLIEHYYNSDEKKTTHVGSIAQYWASMNDWFCKLDSEGYYTMEIQNAALASAISIARELDRYETKTDKAIKKLKKRIYELEEEVERLKAS